jgi:SRSO17 transposase
MTAELEPDPAWVVDDIGFPKQGSHSVAVARQYSGTFGKTGNCQVAVSLHHVGEQGNAPLAWRLSLSEEWAADEQRRKDAGIPDEIVYRTKWQLARDIIDEVRGWGLPDRVVIADAGYGETTEFRDGLESRKLPYVVGISGKVGVWTQVPDAKIPPHRGRGGPPTRHVYGDQRPTSVAEVAVHAAGWKRVRWREGTKGWLESRLWATRVRPSHGFVRGQPPHKEVWLLVEWPAHEEAPTKYFLCDLPASYTPSSSGRIGEVPMED